MNPSALVAALDGIGWPRGGGGGCGAGGGRLSPRHPPAPARGPRTPPPGLGQ